MNVDLQAVNVILPKDERDEHLQRVAGMLARFTTRIESVRVRLEDLNGPKGGLDHRCTVEVFLIGGRRLQSDSMGIGSRDALDAAMQRVRRRIRRHIARGVTRRRNEGTRRRPAAAS